MIYLLAFTAASVMGFPLLWMLISSFKPPPELYQSPPSFLPQQWTLANYRDLFIQTEFARYFVNSLIVASGATVFSLIIGGLGAYSVSRFDLFSTRLFSRFSLIAYMLPEVLLVIPLYFFVVKVGLADTLVALIIANTAFTLPLTIWFMRAYFNAIPVSLEESAMIDGCSRIQALWKVVVPLAVPGLVSVGVFAFNSAWNDFLFALVFVSSETKKTLPLGLSTWIGQDYIYSWGMLLSAAVLITLPVLAFYLLVQRKLIAGLAEGGVKGG
jgi:ABC-type glycerol-3-phosphate transport system permease component